MLKYQFLFLLYSAAVSSNDFGSIEDKVKGIVKEKQPFERLEMKKEDLLKMFEVWSNLDLLSHDRSSQCFWSSLRFYFLKSECSCNLTNDFLHLV